MKISIANKQGTIVYTCVPFVELTYGDSVLSVSFNEFDYLEIKLADIEYMLITED